MAVPHLWGTRTSEYAKVDRCVWSYHFQTACYSAEHWSEKEGLAQPASSAGRGYIISLLIQGACLVSPTQPSAPILAATTWGGGGVQPQLTYFAKYLFIYYYIDTNSVFQVCYH